MRKLRSVALSAVLLVAAAPSVALAEAAQAASPAVSSAAAQAASPAVSSAAARAVSSAAARADQSRAADQKFSADSGDTCRYGFAEGILTWQFASPPRYQVTVDVSGVVGDRPLPDDTNTACPRDPRYTVATFSAYAGRTVLDEQALRVDNAQAKIEITLGANSNVVVIDRVVVQICRISIFPGPYDYCGPAQEYPAPVATTG